MISITILVFLACKQNVGVVGLRLLDGFQMISEGSVYDDKIRKNQNQF